MVNDAEGAESSWLEKLISPKSNFIGEKDNVGGVFRFSDTIFGCQSPILVPTCRALSIHGWSIGTDLILPVT
jgi:hypothetical protein